MTNRVSESRESPKCRRIARSGLAETRQRVIEAIEKGLHPDKAAECFGCGRSTVYGWLSAYRRQGERSFALKKASGRPTLLDRRQLAQLRRWVVGKDPRQLQFEFALWTTEMVRELIGTRFGVDDGSKGSIPAGRA